MNTVGWCVAWIMGCALGLLIIGSPRNAAGIEPLYGEAILLLGLALAFPLALSWRERRARWACLLAMSALGGCGTALLIHPPVTAGDLAFYNAQPDAPHVLVIGEVTGEPTLADRSQRFRFSARQIRVPGESVPRPVKGDLYVFAARYPEYALGARLSLSGALTDPPRLSQFDYPAYLARQNIFSYMSYPKVSDLGSADIGFFGILLSNGRRSVKASLQQGIPEPQAALAIGVVTGDRTGMPKEIQNVFVRSGITHIIAISGQNIALLTGVVWLFFGTILKVRLTILAFIISAAVIIMYTLFTGANPSVVRAAIMGIILLFAPIARRRYDPIAALAITATGMVIIDPDVLTDLGFQLSFAAMLGIVLLSSPLYTLTGRLKIPPFLGLPIAVSVAAQAATTPLIALTLSQISLVALPATLLADIALLPLMITGIAAGIAGAIFPPLAIPFGLLAWPFAAWILWWAQFWSAPSWAALDMSQLNPLWIVAYYSPLAASIWLIYRAKKSTLKPADYITATASAAAFFLWITLAITVLA